MDVACETLVVKRTLAASPPRVFKAFADAGQREIWGAPSETAGFIVEQDQFRVYGTDIVRCGPADDPQTIVETRYLAIVENRLIVVSEKVIDDGNLLAMSQITTDVQPAKGGGTQLCITVQIASLVGQGMIANTKTGHNGSLDNLQRYLAESTGEETT